MILIDISPGEAFYRAILSSANVAPRVVHRTSSLEGVRALVARGFGGVEPLARVVASAVYALDPLIMGLAPAWAMPLALKRAGLTPDQVDVWEVHEAFSAQALH